VRFLFQTSDSIIPLILRIGLGIIIFAHGAQKMLGIWGGSGPSKTVANWQIWFDLSPTVTWLVIIGEFFSPILLIAGFLTRVGAFIISVIIIGAVLLVHRGQFYMNWYMEANRSEGFEFHILILTVTLCLMVAGGGKFSIDRKMALRSITKRS